VCVGILVFLYVKPSHPKTVRVHACVCVCVCVCVYKCVCILVLLCIKPSHPETVTHIARPFSKGQQSITPMPFFKRPTGNALA